jgi:hypothetical protein
MRDWYFVSEAEAAAAAATAAIATGTVGYTNFTTPPSGISVPQNEIWFVHNFTISVPIPLGTDSLIVRPAMLWRPGSANVLVLGPSYGQAGPAKAVAASAQEFWAPAGAQLGMYIESAASATALAASGFLMFTRMRR